MNNAAEENVNGGGRKPVVQKEIGPEDVENVIDFDVDSDEEIDLEDSEQDDYSSEETEPLQAADFLINAEEHQQVPDADEDSDHMSEISQTADDDMSEVSQTVDDNVSEISPTIDNLPEVSVTEGDGNQQAMEGPEDSTVDEDSIDVDQDSQDLEQNVMEIGDILKDTVEHRRGEIDENQLSADGESAPITQWLNTDICASASGESRKLKVKLPVLGKDQECVPSSSDQDQNQDNVMSSLEKDQAHFAKSCLSEDCSRKNEQTSDSGKDQEEPFDSNEDKDRNKGYSGKDKENEGSSNSCEDQNNEINGQDPVEVQQELDEEIDVNVQNAALDEDDCAGTNCRPDSGEDPEDQQLKVEQIVGNEEADVAPELDQEQDVIDAVPELDFVPEDEQNNLVEEIVVERQAVLEPVPADIVAVAVVSEEAAEGQNNEDSEEAKAPFDSFIHMA